MLKGRGVHVRVCVKEREARDVVGRRSCTEKGEKGPADRIALTAHTTSFGSTLLPLLSSCPSALFSLVCFPICLPPSIYIAQNLIAYQRKGEALCSNLQGGDLSHLSSVRMRGSLRPLYPRSEERRVGKECRSRW